MEKILKFYVGIDVSKPYFDASIMQVIDHKKEELQTEQFANNKEGLLSFQKCYKSSGAKKMEQLFVVIEKTALYHRPIWQFCSKQNIALHIGNAAQIKWSLGITRGKNDKIDSKRLCNYAFKNQDDLQATAALNPVFIKLEDLDDSKNKFAVSLYRHKKLFKRTKSKQR